MMHLPQMQPESAGELLRVHELFPWDGKVVALCQGCDRPIRKDAGLVRCTREDLVLCLSCYVDLRKSYP